jgi:pimeloyl-ACP methyl ester carboxylesterase
MGDPADLVAAMDGGGWLPGRPCAFRSLSQQWRTWIAARADYGRIALPVTLVYGEEDWSRPADREANASAIPGARTMQLDRAGHFSCLEKPHEVAELIHAIV